MDVTLWRNFDEAEAFVNVLSDADFNEVMPLNELLVWEEFFGVKF